ncbi:MAG: hypothetical protein HRT89_09020 [Lentisphaeria bacterium]|nr:hypothetical protein [Lentisphaeria bacterium]NQZ68199.1 hypothetical protein [Lentisphaeria bacterium]
MKMNRIRLIIILAATVSFAAEKKKESTIIKRVKRMYTHVYEGNKSDLVTNEKRLDFYDRKAKKYKDAKKDSSKHTKFVKYNSLVEHLTKLVSYNKAIINAFDNGADLMSQIALDDLPNLEREISSITGKEIEREWLTFKEVQRYRKSGWKYKKKGKDIKPHLKSLWYRPNKDKDKKEPKYDTNIGFR